MLFNERLKMEEGVNMKLHHVAVLCSTEENSDRFYEGILGLEKIKKYILNKDLAEQIFSISCEPQIIFYAKGNLAVEVFIPTTSPEKMLPFVHLCLEVEKREQFLQNCRALGIVVKRIQKGESLLAFIEDFDGNLFEIKELPG